MMKNTCKRACCLLLCLLFCLPALSACKEQPDKVISDKGLELFTAALDHYKKSAFRSEAEATVRVTKSVTRENGGKSEEELGAFAQTFSFDHKRDSDPPQFTVDSYVRDLYDEKGEKEFCFTCAVRGDVCVYTDKNGEKTETAYEKDAISKIGPLSLEGLYPTNVYAVTNGKDTRVDLTFSSRSCAQAEGSFLMLVNAFALGQSYEPMVDDLHVTMTLDAASSAFLSFSFSFTARPKKNESAATFVYEYKETFN